MRLSPSSAAAKCRSCLSPAALLLPLLAALFLAGHNGGAAAARELRSGSTTTTLHLPSLPKPELAGAGPLPASSGGVRCFTLVLGEGFSRAGDVTRWGLTVNGTAPGPVLEAVEGETLSVMVESRLAHDNATLHWHGTEQAGTWFMDGVPGVTQCAIPPGGRFHYLFKVDKPGTFWYHSHSTLQYVDGLLGALVVYPKTKQEKDVAAAIPEFVLLAHEWGAKPFREVAGPTLDGGSMMMGEGLDMMMGGDHGMMMGGSRDMEMAGGHGMMKEHDGMAEGDVSGSMTAGSSMTMGEGHHMMMGRRLKDESMTGGKNGIEGSSMMMGGHKTMTGRKEEPVAMSKMMLLHQGNASTESKHQNEEVASGSAMHMPGKAASSAQDSMMMGNPHAPHDADFPWAPHLVNGKGGSLPPREQARAAAGLEVIHMKAGGSARLRVINGSGNWALRLQIEGHVLPVLASDATPVASQDTLLDYVLLGVGERMDILLAATQTPGAYWIYLSSLTGDHVSHAILLVEEGALQGREGMTIQTVPSGPVNPPDVGGPETLVDQARALSAAPSTPPMPLLIPDAGPAQRLRAYLTGRMMPAYEWAIELEHSDAAAAATFGTGFNGPVIRMAHGDVIDLELINQTPMDHPIHKHGSGFWVLDVQSHQNGAADAMMHERPLFKDTVTVPRNGRALIRVKATDAGPWLFHCHTKAHADSGMMAGIVIGDDPGTDWAVPPPLKGGNSYGRMLAAGVCSFGQDTAPSAEEYRDSHQDAGKMKMMNMQVQDP